MISATPASLGTESLLPFDPRASQAPVQTASPAAKDSVSPAAPVRPMGDVLSITGENLPQKPEQILSTLAQLSERAGAGSSEEIQSLQKFLKSTTLDAEAPETFAPRLKNLVEGERAARQAAPESAPRNWMSEVARLAQNIDEAAKTHAPANHVQDLIARAAHSLVEGMAEAKPHAGNESLVARQTAFARSDAQATYALPEAGFAPTAEAGAPAAQTVAADGDPAAPVPTRLPNSDAGPQARTAPAQEGEAAQTEAAKQPSAASTTSQARASHEAGRNPGAGTVQAAPATATEARALERPEASNGPRPPVGTRPEAKAEAAGARAESAPGRPEVPANRTGPEAEATTQPRGGERPERTAPGETPAARDAGRAHAGEGRAPEIRPGAAGPRMTEGPGAFARPVVPDGTAAVQTASLEALGAEGAARMTAQAGGAAAAAGADLGAARAQPTNAWTGVLPLEIGGKLVPARLALEWTKPPEENRDGEGTSGPARGARPVSVALDLAGEDVGRLSVRMTWLNNELVGVFLADRPEMVALAERRIGDLETRLNEAAPGKVTFRVGVLAEGSA